MISTLDRAALRAEARALLRPRPGPPDAAGHRRLAGRPPAQPVGVRRRRGRSPTPACRCCTSSARRARPAAGADRAVPYVVVPFVDRMDLAYAAADLVVCRAGANSVTEAAAVGLPAVFVPLPIGNGEQELNARPVVDAGGGAAGRRRRAHPRVGRARPSRPCATTRPAGRDGCRGRGA